MNEIATKLSDAAAAGDLSLVKEILEPNPTLINSLYGKSNSNILHIAVSSGNVELCKYLHKAKPGLVEAARSSDGLTPLTYAIHEKKVDIVDSFLDQGASTEELKTFFTKWKETYLHLVAGYKNGEALCKILFEKGICYSKYPTHIGGIGTVCFPRCFKEIQYAKNEDFQISKLKGYTEYERHQLKYWKEKIDRSWLGEKMKEAIDDAIKGIEDKISPISLKRDVSIMPANPYVFRFQ